MEMDLCPHFSTEKNGGKCIGNFNVCSQILFSIMFSKCFPGLSFVIRALIQRKLSTTALYVSLLFSKDECSMDLYCETRFCFNFSQNNFL